MKKQLLVLALSFGLLTAGSLVSFADSENIRDNDFRPGYGYGYSHHMFYDSDLTYEEMVEEMLEYRSERIDQLIEDKVLTAQEGEKFKELLEDEEFSCHGYYNQNDKDDDRPGLGYGPRGMMHGRFRR